MPASSMYLEEPNSGVSKKNYVIPRRVAQIGCLLTVLIFIGAIIAAYNAKSIPEPNACPETTKVPQTDCKSLFCENPFIFNEWNDSCPLTTIRPDQDTTPRPKVITNYRLPKNLKPYFYEILIKPYFSVSQEPLFYNGHVLIKLKCLKNTSKLILHKHQDIEIDNMSFEVRSLTDTDFIPINQLRQSNYLVDDWSYDNETQFFKVEFYKEIFIENQEYTVGIGFKGVPKSDNYGLYKSSYIGNNEAKRWLLATQMEPTDARKAFPCFDEPDLKAKFKIRVLHDSSLNVLSNMPVKSSTKIESIDSSNYNWIQTDFYETVEMSTYLVALIISDFECLTNYVDLKFTKNVSVSVCARPNAKHQLNLALNASVYILKFFEQFYNIGYPLPKLDHVALPDFSAGAMENWGLITYRESRLLYDPVKTSESAEQSIIEVIAHEIAHQWFGNLVSPSWWTDLWLNEGFARYMEILGTHAFKNEWNMFDQILKIVFSIMELDSVQSSHPISIEVTNPDEINEIFDGITYGKGASIIRMMYYFLGEDNFNRGLREYLKKFSYSNAIQDDLWQTLQQFSDINRNLNLTHVLNSWTKQMGYPLITVKLLNKTHISLNQEHFLYDSSLPVQESPYNYKWYVPFAFTVEKLTNSRTKASEFNVKNIYNNILWIKPNQTETIIKLDESFENSNYILGNLDSLGFYRVNYDDSNWNMIKLQLLTTHKSIPVRMRSNLISDIFSLLQANKIESHKPFEFIEYLKYDNEYLPWYSLVLKLGYFFDMIESTEIYGEFRKYVLDLVEPIYLNLGWNDKKDDSWLTKKLRSLIIQLACRLDYENCIEKSIKLYKDWMKNPSINNIPINFRSVVYCTAIKFGTFSEWSFASSLYDKETDSNSKRELQSGMACSKEQWIQIKYLKDQLNLNKTRKQDGLFGVRYSALNLYSNKLTWNFIKNNWNTLTERYGGSMSFSYLVSDVSSKFNTINEYNDFTTFFGNVSAKSAKRQIKISSEKIKANIKWVNRNYEGLKKWFTLVKNTTNQQSINYRLPDNLKPYLYDLKLKVNIRSPDVRDHAQFSFDGIVKINFKCLKPTNKIVLHQKQLKIHNVNLYRNSSLVQIDKELEYDSKREFLIIKLINDCVQDMNYTLHINYTGYFTDNLSGFYLSSYIDPSNKINYIATTQFEPTDARRAFPCFDEPALKAEFKISIIRHRNFSSVSNMPLLRSEAINRDYFIDSFEKSVSMSTYLVAFIVSNYKTIRKLSAKYNVSIEVMARPEAIDKGQGDFALEEAARIIDFFSDYFNTTYPLSKSTQIAIPDFNAGAMENWGLITYREKYLLYNPDYDSISSKRLVSIVISHELAHQWFGNLVSPLWWNDLWLNEGFASWVEFLGTNYTHPEWKLIDYFIVEKMSSMVKDSLESSHPISVDVNDPNEINSIFDDISYDKGSSLVRMMNSFLTIDTFKKGISNYLKKYAFSNANQDMLWNELCTQACKDGRLKHSTRLKSIMDTWTLKKGYPVINVKKYSEDGLVKLSLEQKWFLLNPLSKSLNLEEYNNTKWFVPFTFTIKSNPNFNFESRPYWLDNQTGKKILEINAGESDWVIGNVKFSGYYRVNYDLKNWNLLIQQLKENYKAIDVVNRALLIDDSFNLARAEHLDINVFFNLVSYLKNETENIPFDIAQSSLRFIDSMISASDYHVYNKYKEFTKSLYQNSYDRLGWLNQSDISDISLQIASISTMCFYGHFDCVKKCREYFTQWIIHNQTLPQNLRKTILNTIAQHGNESDWFYLYKRAEDTKNYQEKIEILKALTNTKDYNCLNLILKATSNRSLIRSQDEDTLIRSISRNSIGKTLLWDFLMEKWDKFIEKMDNPMVMNEVFKDVFKNYNTRYDLKKLENFYEREANEKSINLSVFKEIVENIVTNIRWMDTNYNKISEWLLN